MVLGLGSLLLWVLLQLRRSRPRDNIGQPVRLALFVFMFSVGVTYALAMSRPMPSDERSPADVAVLALLSWAGTLLLTQDGIDRRGRLEVLAWRLALCGGAIAVLGLVQILTRRLWVDEVAIPGLTSTASDGLSYRGGFPRPAGTATHPIEYGVILAMVFPITWHVAFFHTSRPLCLRVAPALALSAVAPLTSSRSAYVGIALALAVCLLGWSRRRRLYILGLTSGGSMLMIISSPHFVTSVTELFTGAPNDPSIESRTQSYALAADFIGRSPWFGRGLGTFLPKYRIFDNEYLLLLVTVGIVGTVAFIALGIVAITIAWRVRLRSADDTMRDLALTLSAAVVAGFVCLFMFDAFAFPMTMGTLFLILGMIACLHRIDGGRTVTRGLSQPRDAKEAAIDVRQLASPGDQQV